MMPLCVPKVSTSIRLVPLSVYEVGMAGWGGLNGTKVDNIKLQQLGCFFFTVLFGFLEEWKGFTYQSQAEVDQ